MDARDYPEAYLSEELEAYGTKNHVLDKAAIEIKRLRQQLAEKDAEIERLRGMVDEIQAARHVHREHNRLLTNLASSLAREQHVMCVVEQVALALDAYFSYERGLDQYIEELNGLYKESQDTTALSAMIAKAGIKYFIAGAEYAYSSTSGGDGMTITEEEAIRALPAVTIDDLK